MTLFQAHKIHRGRKIETRLTYFSESIPDLPALKHGRTLEPIARKRFEEIVGCPIFVPGLVIRPAKPWLGASPDGAYLDENGQLKLLEIKCPVPKDGKDIFDVTFLDKNYELKRSHDYFTQIQVAMYCCKAKECDFFVYSPDKYKLLTVKYDHGYT